MIPVKLLVFLTGLSLLAFIRLRFKENYTEPYAFNKFMDPNHHVEGNKIETEVVQLDHKDNLVANKAGDSNDDLGGGE
ncbi:MULTISPECIES: hypothetical protein [Bacillaceae]|uniref:Uncharacterized protein n=1 Tax=Evansella alkalicola TaxID=745819 RepID=A0ABS6JUM8_9BACI|nr:MULTISPECIES: hypothetical protein [Bacillaceae]MBU9722208.1 hypothetical protein [Bacillus alkalicola]